MSGPGCCLEQARRVLERHFGEVLETARGQNFRRTRWAFTLGVGLNFGEPDKKGKPSPIPDDQTHVVVVVPGQACAVLGPDAVELVRDLAKLGFHATRLDAAIDFHEGLGSHLPDCIAEASDAGEVVRKPVCRNITERRGDRVTGRTVYLGSNQSRFYLRCYDKGLQQAPMTARPGQWVRWEVQHTSESCAAQAFMLELIKARPGQLVRTITAAALGAFDFRERSPYGNDRHVKHREVLGWFRELVDMFGRTVLETTRRLPTAEGTRRHLVNAVRMLNTLAAAAGGNLDHAVQLLGQAATSRAPRRPGSGLDSMLFRFRVEGVLS